MPEPLSDITASEITARVLAWHHRHPLARRLGAADVHSIGHVAVPFADPGAPPPAPTSGSLRERAMAQAQAPSAAPSPAGKPGATGPLKAAFDEDLLPPLAPAEVAAWALAHGVERAREPLTLPVRRLPMRPGTPGPAWRWLLTAELRDGTARTRVLLGPASGAPVLGRRLWSPVRLGLLAGLCGALLAAAAVLLLKPAAPAGTLADPGLVLPSSGAAASPAASSAAVPAAAVAATSPASAVAAAAVPSPASAAPAASAASTPPLAAAPSQAASAAPGATPADVEPRLGRIDLPTLGPLVDERRRRAAEAAAAAASAAKPATPPPPAAITAAAAGAPAFALATRVLRTRTESQQIAEALRSLLVVPGSPAQQVDVLPVGDDFRVVARPYPGREAAERAAAALAARGHRVQVIEF